MALPIKNIILDIWQQPTEILRLVQYESAGREVQFTLTDAGQPFNLTGLTVMLEILKPDGTVVVMPCDVINAAGGVVKSTIVSQAVVVAGVGAAQLRIYKSGQVTKTFSMRVAVTESINADGIAPSTSEFTALHDLIVEVQSWGGRLDDVERQAADALEVAQGADEMAGMAWEEAISSGYIAQTALNQASSLANSVNMLRTITLSDTEPTGANEGDIWFKPVGD